MTVPGIVLFGPAELEDITELAKTVIILHLPLLFFFSIHVLQTVRGSSEVTTVLG